MLTEGHWIPIKDGDPRAYALFRRHYSFVEYKNQRRTLDRRFAGPGEKMVLLTEDCRALWVWRRFIDPSGQQGVGCSIFRNEGPLLSSVLITEACGLADRRWPGERQYTYINPSAIKSSNPGYCYKIAGWSYCGKTPGGLHVLERLPVVSLDKAA